MITGKYFRFIIAVITLAQSGIALSKNAPSKKEKSSPRIAIIGNIDGESSDKLSIATIRLNTKPDIKLPKIETHESFLQIKIPNTMTPEPGTFFDLKGPWLKKAVVLQVDETDTIVRFFVNGDAGTVGQASELDLLNKRLVLSVSHKYLSTLTAGKKIKEDHDEAKIVAGSRQDSDLQTELLTQKKQDISTPSSLKIKETFSERPSESGSMGHFDMNSYLVKLTWVSVGILMLTLILLSLRRVLRNKKLLTTGSSSVTMKTLNDLVLAPRQKLSVVQVGTERLLLSVSPERISLLSHMDELRKNNTPFGSESGSQHNMKDLQPSVRLNKLLKNHRQKISSSDLMETSTKIQSKNQQKMTGKKVLKKKKPSGSDVTKPVGSGVQYRIDDSGVHSAKASSSGSGAVISGTEKAIDDVTQLIREKLKSLPKL